MKRRWYPAVAAGLFAADQAVKTGVSQNMDKGAEKKLAGKAVLRRVENRGLCLGLLSGSPAVVRGLSAAASGIVTVLFGAALAGRKGACRKAGYTMMAAGAWSNTFDRFARGHVVYRVSRGCAEVCENHIQPGRLFHRCRGAPGGFRLPLEREIRWLSRPFRCLR